MPSDRSPAGVVSPVVRTRQYREFTDEPPTDAELAAILDAARWTGSAGNEQPWRFVVVRDPDRIRRLGEAGLPQTRGLLTAPVAIAIVLPLDTMTLARTYDDGRAAERILIAASMLGLGSGISWVRDVNRPAFAEILGLPHDRYVRTIMTVGHPTEAARAPKAKPGEARLPRDEVVYEERWPEG
jgi:nitroreductase